MQKAVYTPHLTPAQHVPSQAVLALAQHDKQAGTSLQRPSQGGHAQGVTQDRSLLHAQVGTTASESHALHGFKVMLDLCGDWWLHCCNAGSALTLLAWAAGRAEAAA